MTKSPAKIKVAGVLYEKIPERIKVGGKIYVLAEATQTKTEKKPVKTSKKAVKKA
jgi:hypothetical protein